MNDVKTVTAGTRSRSALTTLKMKVQTCRAAIRTVPTRASSAAFLRVMVESMNVTCPIRNLGRGCALLDSSMAIRTIRNTIRRICLVLCLAAIAVHADANSLDATAASSTAPVIVIGFAGGFVRHDASVLSGLSCVAGIAIAVGLLRALLALAPPDLPRLSEVTISWPVLGFTAGISLLAAIGLGITTSVRATSGSSGGSLIEGGRGTVGTQRSERAGRAIVAAQLAMTLALLTGAGLLGRSLLRLLSVDPGFRTDHIVAMDLELQEPADVKAQGMPVLRARRPPLVNRLIKLGRGDARG